jgi:hypothetical protein
MLLKSGFHSSSYKVLKPFRDLRPVNKGPAYTAEMITHVSVALRFRVHRILNIDCWRILG